MIADDRVFEQRSSFDSPVLVGSGTMGDYVTETVRPRLNQEEADRCPEASCEDRQSRRLPGVLSDSRGPPGPGRSRQGGQARCGAGQGRNRERLVGWGECHAGRAPGTVAQLANTTLKELILGMDASGVVGVWDRIYKMQLATHGTGAACAMAMSGVDLALWDIRAQAAGWPLYKLLGGRARPIRAYAGGVMPAASRWAGRGRPERLRPPTRLPRRRGTGRRSAACRFPTDRRARHRLTRLSFVYSAKRCATIAESASSTGCWLGRSCLLLTMRVSNGA